MQLSGEPPRGRTATYAFDRDKVEPGLGELSDAELLQVEMLTVGRARRMHVARVEQREESST